MAARGKGLASSLAYTYRWTTAAQQRHHGDALRLVRVCCVGVGCGALLGKRDFHLVLDCPPTPAPALHLRLQRPAQHLPPPPPPRSISEASLILCSRVVSSCAYPPHQQTRPLTCNLAVGVNMPRTTSPIPFAVVQLTSNLAAPPPRPAEPTSPAQRICCRLC
jgi:hypothetical protein